MIPGSWNVLNIFVHNDKRLDSDDSSNWCENISSKTAAVRYSWQWTQVVYLSHFSDWLIVRKASERERRYLTAAAWKPPVHVIPSASLILPHPPGLLAQICSTRHHTVSSPHSSQSSEFPPKLFMTVDAHSVKYRLSKLFRREVQIWVKEVLERRLLLLNLWIYGSLSVEEQVDNFSPLQETN